MISFVKMPQISLTMLDGVVMKWHKKVGDTVQTGEGLLDVETDKVVETMGSPYSGVVRSIDAACGDIVAVGGTLCSIETIQDVVDTSSIPVTSTPDLHEPKALGLHESKRLDDERVAATPLARKIAAERGIDLRKVQGTGVRGMITQADLPMAQPSRAEPPSPITVAVADDTIIPLTAIRKRIADNLTHAQSIPAVTTFAEVQMSSLKELRRYMKVSYTTFVVRAAALALREYRSVNSQLKGENIVQKGQVNVSVAVSTDRGLLTPVILNTDHKNLLTLAEELGELSEHGRSGRLTSSEMTGGTFTVTNSGVFGAMFFTPLLNPPQCAILGMGKIFTPVLLNEQGEMTATPLMMLSLSYDHRIVDGDTAVRFLQRIKYLLEHPIEMLAPERMGSDGSTNQKTIS